MTELDLFFLLGVFGLMMVIVMVMVVLCIGTELMVRKEELHRT